MKKLFGIAFFSFVLFLAEVAIFQIFGSWFKPNLLILLVVYSNLKFGIRYGIFASLIGGILSDSFGSGIFGVHIISFMFCSYILALVRKYFLQFDALSFKFIISGFFSSLNVILIYFISSIFLKINFSDVFIFIFLPEVAATVAVSPFCFDYLRKCDLKLLN
ncbi:MAG: rod shape-determining protein MreD [Candidatus Omnitrophica bacterium]|nr:rod shape-determining protein MreD [Candidatus Omnitrophota bacterium]